MRLLTFRSDTGESHVGLLRDNQIIDLSIWLSQGAGHSGSALDMLRLIALGEAGTGMCHEALTESDAALNAAGALVPFSTSLLLAPIPRPTKNVVCLGRNYLEHMKESIRAFGEAPQPPPEHPVFFTKAPTAVAGPYEDLHFDFSISDKLDWEAELGFVLGTGGKNIKREEALDYVFGYLVVNDISARDLQKRHGNQYFKGKSLDNSCPIGPWIVTSDEVPDPADLRVYTRVNGEEKQNGYTGDMFAGVPEIVEALSEGMTLEPGDIVATGTPTGVGHARNPPEFLKHGDVVECEVDKVGVIRNRIVGD
jgi:2-keto-4-pentenoate hydratase/2-oxohepta-3-ene-1,7-dioic acid hydratase in catechol pathway